MFFEFYFFFSCTNLHQLKKTSLKSSLNSVSLLLCFGTWTFVDVKDSLFSSCKMVPGILNPCVLCWCYLHWVSSPHLTAMWLEQTWREKAAWPQFLQPCLQPWLLSRTLLPLAMKGLLLPFLSHCKVRWIIYIEFWLILCHFFGLKGNEEPTAVPIRIHFCLIPATLKAVQTQNARSQTQALLIRCFSHICIQLGEHGLLSSLWLMMPEQQWTRK